MLAPKCNSLVLKRLKLNNPIANHNPQATANQMESGVRTPLAFSSPNIWRIPSKETTRELNLPPAKDFRD